MSQDDTAAPEGAAVIRKEFTIAWIDLDLPIMVYGGITGSAKDENWLFLFSEEGVETWINLDQVLRMSIWTEQ